MTARTFEAAAQEMKGDLDIVMAAFQQDGRAFTTFGTRDDEKAICYLHGSGPAGWVGLGTCGAGDDRETFDIVTTTAQQDGQALEHAEMEKEDLGIVMATAEASVWKCQAFWFRVARIAVSFFVHTK